jgi:arabinofuranan 3-O-arabinosyltransferase
MEAWLIDKDFVNYWTASRLLLGGQVLDLFADHATYFRHLTAEFGADSQWRNWSYPPHYLLAIWPLGFLGYVPALLAFMAVTFAAWLVAVRAFLGRFPREASGLLILAPAILDNLRHAQNGFLTAALMLGGLALRQKRPVLAGVLLGCLTVKPQLGVLIPLFLLAERQWRVIGAAVLTTVALVLLSGTLFGWESWHGYLTQTLPYQSRVMTEFTGGFQGMMPTVFAALRAMEVSPDLALTLHGAVALGALALAARIVPTCPDAGLRAALLIMTTLVVVPYWLSYDYTIAAAALLLADMRASARDPQAGRHRAVLVLAALTPIAAVPLWDLGLPLSPLLVLAGFAAVARSAVAARNLVGQPLLP